MDCSFTQIHTNTSARKSPHKTRGKVANSHPLFIKTLFSLLSLLASVCLFLLFSSPIFFSYNSLFTSCVFPLYFSSNCNRCWRCTLWVRGVVIKFHLPRSLFSRVFSVVVIYVFFSRSAMFCLQTVEQKGFSTYSVVYRTCTVHGAGWVLVNCAVNERERKCIELVETIKAIRLDR